MELGVVEVSEPVDRENSGAPVEEDSGARLASIIESVLFAAGGPMSVKDLVEILKGPRGSGPKAKEIEKALTELLDEYAPGKRGIQLLQVGGGYQFRTARENAQWVRAVFRDKPARLGRATLETLAIVAYKQPATRADIESVRGVDAEAALATLLERRLVKIAGRKETVGRPLLYSTTPEFLEAFGLNDLKDLPSLKELGPVPDAQEENADAASEAEAATASEAQAATAPNDTQAATAPSDTHTGTEPGWSAATAKAAEPGGDHLTPQGGGDDRSGPRTGERPGGDTAGDESGPADRPDHG
jgi:segregation and condensation protein B